MLLKQWEKLSKYPGGHKLFSYLFGRMVPYSGSIFPEIIKLTPGHVIIKIQDRKKIRNHLNSIHAAALMNLAEATSGLSFVVGLPPEARAIVVEFTMQYLKKARGVITAEAQCTPPSSLEKSEHFVEAILKDESQDIVAKGRAKWLVSPPK